MMVPEYGVSVIICSWVEPKVDPLLSITLSMCIHIRLDCVRLPAPIPQELKIQLISHAVGV